MEIGILVKENNQTKKLIKPERLFLMIALVAGLIFTVAQPLFIEQIGRASCRERV